MKRFYREVSLERVPTGFRVLLDGRAIKTQGGKAQVVPTAALGQAMVAEWADQNETIDLARFACRDMADYAIDVIALDPAATIAALAGYAGSDTLCYRGLPDEPITPHQAAQWDPIVTAAETRFGAQFTRVAGVMPQPQPPATIAAIAAHIGTLDPFTLAALRNLAGLAASVIIGLAALEPAAPLAALWEAACLEELWQAELWGKEPEAEARRARQYADFLAAARLGELVRG